MLPTPMGGQWSEYVRSQIGRLHRSWSVSSSAESLDFDNARYMTHRIVQHASALATETRSLLTNSPGSYFQPILHERWQMPEDMHGDMNMPVGPLHVDILPGSL